ncbi:fasciclin domain-containing protein [Parasphingopyxis algicola]|uniref:fasciclin domain-containing protein n=1 Tax=Parasphingopyxis algicola TaxID=2026624 RepID=UPI0015A14D03|nr:fasciclin domain-containing protein [Parasphingopyxis algicola]QLC24655.1 fasciclin domain-containing protein [Parasphingopyxis algicola]
MGLALFALGSAPALADHHGGASHDGDAEMTTQAETTETVTVGGAEMLPTRNIVENASNSPIHTTLVAAVAQAELVETLSGPGPFTVFAPTNEAFGLLPAGTVDALMQDAARAQLAQILTYHVVSGAVDAETLVGMIEEAGGELTLTTVEGSPLVATLDNGAVSLRDEIGGVSYVTQTDVPQSNGVIHVINGVLVPEPETAGAGDR